jgi:hypothetical protein
LLKFRGNGSEYAQFSRSDPEVKRRPQEHDFSVERDGNTLLSCASADIRLFRAEYAQIVFGIRKAE